eukprot:7391742-Prymnesium_polylepis.1
MQGGSGRGPHGTQAGHTRNDSSETDNERNIGGRRGWGRDTRRARRRAAARRGMLLGRAEPVQKAEDDEREATREVTHTVRIVLLQGDRRDEL